MKFTKFGSLQSVVLALACAWSVTPHALAADNQDAVKSNGISTIEAPLGDRFSMAARIPARQTRVIFYRPTTQTQPGAATIYVNGNYHASLIAGAYAELCMVPNQAEIGVRMAKVGDRPKDNLEAITLQKLNAGQTTFMRLREAGTSGPVFEPIRSTEALAELQATRQQIHTISRVPDAQPCIDAGAAAPEVTKQINLAADTLFAFGKSSINSMSLTGRQSLDDLVRKIKSEYLSVDHINLIGHSDPLGNEAYNERLANERALTVRTYLLSHGLPNTRITGQSKGAREPLVTTCSKVLSPASVLCNQPNRRVIVEVSGVQRSN
ncbi:MAG: OmpA family protein [Limnohabitans sp.]